MRHAVEEVGGAIERVDDPARLVRIALDLAAFLEQHAPVGPGVAQLLDDRLLGALVGHRHEVGRSLAADLQLLDLAEVAAQARRRLAGGALHDGDQAGVGYHRSVRAADIFAVVDVDDDLGARRDVRRNQHLHAIVEHRRLVADELAVWPFTTASASTIVASTWSGS